MNDWPEIYLDFGNNTVQFNWKMDEIDEDMPGLEEIPIDVDVSVQKIDNSAMGHIEPFAWSNQGKSIGDWVKHICSIFRCELYEADFHIGKIKYHVQSLRNIIPKLSKAGIYCFTAQTSEHDIKSTQNILTTFLPCVKHFRLYRVPLQGNLSIQHIGMANLKELEVYYPQNPKLDDLLTLNAERCTILGNRFSLRDLNRFFKLWTKGSNPRLKFLMVHGNKGTIPSRNVL
ncbi:Protein CBG20210 [Caenorhabditis briggsae]|uniref:Protein CBG20210 n=1 Tax=Caenorhabditis briggsae TaxID=6238 RepID=A8XX68_CAEBR|nr:Protein CBG20210 [Caenorhabditis briggsae]CAP37237.1 Protein CBG20210 [Caenorhabditis briggsae]